MDKANYRAHAAPILHLLLWICLSSRVCAATPGPAPSKPGVKLEYCQWETFNATCGLNAVLLITSARYGRMHVGRCQPTDYYIGCSADVIGHVAERCSGRRGCQINIPDPELFKNQPCRKDLVAYFEVSYDCIAVASPSVPRPVCRGPIPLDGALSGYIATSVTHRTNLGSIQCPWVITVQPGQQLNFTLYDYSTRGQQHSQQQTGNRKSSCGIVALFKEPGGHIDYLRLCADDHRQRAVYLSEQHEVEVQIVNSSKDNLSINYLLKYEAVGCPTPGPVPYGYTERRGEALLVACNHTLQLWHLVCRGAHWIGEFHNCSQVTTTAHEEKFYHKKDVPLGLLVAIAIGVVVGVALGFIFLITVFMCRRRRKRALPKEANVLLGDSGCDDAAPNIYRLVEVLPTRDTTLCDCGMPDSKYCPLADPRRPLATCVDAGDYEYQRTLTGSRRAATEVHPIPIPPPPPGGNVMRQDSYNSGRVAQLCDIISDVTSVADHCDGCANDIYKTLASYGGANRVQGTLKTFKGSPPPVISRGDSVVSSRDPTYCRNTIIPADSTTHD